MKKKKQVPVEQQAPFYPYSDKEQLLVEVMEHYGWWRDDNEIRKTRPNGLNDVTNAYYGKLPEDWPFISRTTDPRIRTSLLEKNARLTNKPMRGKVVPREGGDVVSARLNNAVINFQWDAANNGGSMSTKIGISDIDSRMYGSKFVYIPWKVVFNGERLCFEGNEVEPLNIMDCGMDPNCDHIRSAKWFQHRSWELLSDMEENADLYPGLAELKLRVSKKKNAMPQSRRDSKYLSQVKQIRGLEDRMGTDSAFPVIEKVVEYRKDKWIIFAPGYNVILAVIDNPFDHGLIPIEQLRYYPTDGDNLGESEVESVLPLWKAIQAVLCAFLDEVIIKMRPPLKVVEGAVRTETIVYNPEAMWLMDNINAVSEVESRGDSVQYFQNIYPALISAFNVAMGELSQGTSNIDPMSADKTATEIRQVAKQQNIRDQKNQLELSEFIKGIVHMWMSNNKQFLFKDPDKHEHVLKIVGSENFEYFKRLGMDEMVLTEEAANYVQEIVQSFGESGTQLTDGDLNTMIEAAKVPKYPVIENPDEKDSSKLRYKTKMKLSETGDQAELSILPYDMEGHYDFIPDMQSMEASASEQLMMARSQAIAQITNPNLLQLLQLEGQRPKIKDLLIADLEDKGLKDAERFFEPAQPPIDPAQAGFNPTGGTLPNSQALGMGNVPQAPTQPAIDQQMAGSNQVF